MKFDSFAYLMEYFALGYWGAFGIALLMALESMPIIGLFLLAAIQAPIIMMSQNRQEDSDRIRADNDCQVNLKSEVEIRMLGEKLDHLLHQEMRRFLEIRGFAAD